MEGQRRSFMTGGFWRLEIKEPEARLIWFSWEMLVRIDKDRVSGSHRPPCEFQQFVHIGKGILILMGHAWMEIYDARRGTGKFRSRREVYDFIYIGDDDLVRSSAPIDGLDEDDRWNSYTQASNKSTHYQGEEYIWKGMAQSWIFANLNRYLYQKKRIHLDYTLLKCNIKYIYKYILVSNSLYIEVEYKFPGWVEANNKQYKDSLSCWWI